MNVKKFPIETGTSVRGREIMLGRRPFVQGDVMRSEDGHRLIPTRVRVPNLSQFLTESGLDENELDRVALFAHLAAQAASDVDVTPDSEVTILDWERLECQEFNA